MIAVTNTYFHLKIPIWKMTVASCNFCMKRNILITQKNVTFVRKNFPNSLMKGFLPVNSCRLHTLGSVSRFASAQSDKLSVPSKDKYTKHGPRQCCVSVAMAMGLLVGWTVLELHRHSVSCVAEATETAAECHDSKEPAKHCQVLSLEEAIHESDQLLQRVKVKDNYSVGSFYYSFGVFFCHNHRLCHGYSIIYLSFHSITYLFVE